MDVCNNNVSIQINAKDLAGKRLRISDCDVFIVHVFTNNPKQYLTFSKRDMLMTEFVDELVVPKHQMEQLESGVVQYTYHYLPMAHDCVYEEDKVEMEGCYNPHHHHGRHPHEDLINSRPEVTSIYWRNLRHPHHPDRPLNTVTLVDLERVHRLIENERITREKDIESLQSQFGEDYSSKLEAEIERSTAEDEKFAKALEKLGADLDDFTGNSVDINDKVQGEIIANTQGLKDEVERAVKAEAQLDAAISAEIARAKAAEEVNSTAIQMEKERATANEGNLGYRIDAVNEKFEAFKTIESNSLSTEVERAKSVESQINTRVDGVVKDLADEVSRAAQKDIEHTNLVSTESNRAQAVENKIATDLETETNRAKDAEKHILDEVHGVHDAVANLATATNVYTKAEVDNKVNAVRNDVSTLENWVNNHGDDTSALKAKVDNLVVDVDKAKADILAEVAKCDAQNGKLATDIQTLSDSTYTKAEVDSKVSVIDSSLAGINNWIENHKDNTEGLADKVNKNIADIQSLTTDLANETTARVNADLTLTTKVEVAEGKVDAEVERAKAAEKLISDEVADIKTQAQAKHTDIETAIADTNANLTLEVARAKAAEKVNADAIEIINGDVSTAGSIKKSLADAKEYTDAEIAKLSLAKDAEIADTLKVYATKSEVDQKISDVIGTAPEALDTLGKISDALGQDSDAITAINGILAGKADADNVYTKSEVDTAITGVNNSISTLETKVDNADAALTSRIDDLSAKVSGIETQAGNDVSAINAAIDAEIVRAKAAEKANTDKLDSEIGKVNDKVNDLTAKVIQDIADSTAKDTEIDANISAINTLLSNVDAKIDAEVARATAKDNELVAADTSIAAKVQANSDNLASEIARAKQVETEINDKINAINLDSTNSNLSAEVDRATAAETTLQSNIDAEATRAKAAEKVVSDNLADEIVRAKAAEKALDDKISALDLDGANSAISGVNDKIESEITRATAQETALGNSIQTVSDNLSAEITRAKAAEQANADAIAAIDLTSIRNDVSTLDNKVDIETTRAKAAEKANADNIDALQTSVAGVNDSVTNLSVALTQLQADSQAKDSEIESNLATEKSRAENAEAALDAKISVINGDASVVGSIAHAIHDAEHYTDDEVAKVQSALEIHKAEADAKYLTEHQSLADYYNKSVINEIFDGYATKGALVNLADELGNMKATTGEGLALKANKSEVYSKTEIDGIIEVANTQINSKLPIDSFNEWSEGVAMKSNVYTKSEVDQAIENVDVTEQLKDYVTNSSLVEAVDNAVADSEQFVTLSTNLDAETARAQAAEQEIIDSISAVNSTLEQAIEDLDNMFGDAEGEGEAGEPVKIATISTVERMLDEYYDKAEIDALIPDVSGMLTKAEADAEYQPKGNYLTEHQSLDDYMTNSYAQAAIAVGIEAVKAQMESRISKLEDIDHDAFLTAHQSLDNYYTKSQVDAKIPDVSDMLTKSEADAEYQQKGDYLTEHQSLDEIHAAIADKADASAVYTKSEVNSMISDLIWTGSADEYQALKEADQLADNKLYIVISND